MAERFNLRSSVPSWVQHEHIARYKFASLYVDSKIVVDAACGSGIGSAMFAKSGAKVVEAFDVSESAVSEAKLQHVFENLRFRQSDCLHLPLPDRYADLYISLETIEHVDSDSLFLKEAVRILRSGGTFICSTPNRNVTNPGTALSDKPRNPFHVREYSRHEFLRLLSGSFGQITLFGQNFQAPWVFNILQTCGKVMPKYFAARTPLLFKIPKLFPECPEKYQVTPVIKKREYEYWVAVCSKPFLHSPKTRSS